MLRCKFEKVDNVTTTTCSADCIWLHNHCEEQWLATQLWLHGEFWVGVGAGPVPWSRHPSGKHCFNRNCRVWGLGKTSWNIIVYSDSKVHGSNTVPTWVLSAPDGPHLSPMKLAIGIVQCRHMASLTANELILNSVLLGSIPNTQLII